MLFLPVSCFSLPQWDNVEENTAHQNLVTQVLLCQIVSNLLPPLGRLIVRPGHVHPSAFVLLHIKWGQRGFCPNLSGQALILNLLLFVNEQDFETLLITGA